MSLARPIELLQVARASGTAAETRVPYRTYQAHESAVDVTENFGSLAELETEVIRVLVNSRQVRRLPRDVSEAMYDGARWHIVRTQRVNAYETGIVLERVG